MTAFSGNIAISLYVQKTFLFAFATFNLLANNCSEQLEIDSLLKQQNIATSATNCATKKAPLKEWTLIVYLSADNDLRGFAARNIKQMAKIGSNHNLNILVQLDIRITGNQKITRRYLIEKGKIIHLNAHDPLSQQMDSGDPKTLVSCCKWAIENYPANHYALVIWNHGTGIIDPVTGKVIRPVDLFAYNSSSHKLELDRSIGFFDFIGGLNEPVRGVCWDDSTGHYLTNQKLEGALREICASSLQGKKFDLIIFDACLMSMLEVANIVKKYAHIMTGSQEVELGTGLDYSKALEPFLFNAPSAKTFSSHIVHTYEQTYGRITNDFTHSAINLDSIDFLENNVDSVAKLLIEALQAQKNRSVKNAIRASRNKLLCTHFDEPSYIDLHHFYRNLQANLRLFSLNSQEKQQEIVSLLSKKIQEGLFLVEKNVIANVTGKNLSQARGISVYFPEHRIHSSYRKTNFAHTNSWASLLTQYLFA